MNPHAQAISAEFAEISDINREFLRILCHPATLGLPELLGLSSPVIEVLHSLRPGQLQKISCSPLLLADFQVLPGEQAFVGVAEAGLPFAVSNVSWQQELNAFADRLLTFLWQATRRQSRVAGFSIGFDTRRADALSGLSFSRIGRSANQAAGCLQARLAKHPSFWRDLVGSAYSGEQQRQVASQLSILQLSVNPRKMCVLPEPGPLYAANGVNA